MQRAIVAGAGNLVEVGARTFYQMRSHPRQKPWSQCQATKRDLYYDYMRHVLETLAREGYVFRRQKGT